MTKKYIWEFEEEKRKKLQAQKDQLKKKEKKEKLKKKKKKIIKICIICLIIIFIVFTPFFKVKKISLTGNFFFDSQTILDDINLENRFSIFTYIKGRSKDKKTLFYLDQVKINYEIKSKEVLIEVKEKTPLYHDEKGQNYYIDQNKNIGMWDINYQTPLIYNLEFQKEVDNQSDTNKPKDDYQENTNENTNEIETINVDLLDTVLEQLSLLDYDIRMQIKSIELADFEIYGENVLKINMQDKNTIYIYPYQIQEKMQYYNQMKQILDKNKKTSGNIYLYIGDYYEPYE